MGAVACDILYISVIVLCRFRLAAAVLIVDPVCVFVCRSLGGGDGIFGVVVCDDGVNLMLFLIIGGYSGGAFLFLCCFLGGWWWWFLDAEKFIEGVFLDGWLIPQCLKCLLLPLEM